MNATRPRTTRWTPALPLAALLAALLAPASAGADELGRLFFTPQQRQELDRRRNSNAQEADTVVEQTVTVNGQVTRSSGRTTTWVNGVPQYDTYRPVDRTHVRLEGATVKVGETLDRSRGAVEDVVAPGAIKIRSGGAPAPQGSGK